MSQHKDQTPKKPADMSQPTRILMLNDEKG